MTRPGQQPVNSTAAHLLVVDDDVEVTHVLHRYFTAQGFRVSTAENGAGMRSVIAAQQVDIVMLDLGLPDEDGFTLTRHLREHWRGPVIIVSGRGESVDRVVGLELGADDYVTKPFDLRELLARVRSVLRRSTVTGHAASPSAEGPAETASDRGRYCFDEYVLDMRAHTLHDPAGREIDLTSGEFALLRVFLEHPNQALTRDALMTHLHGREAHAFDRSIDMQVGRLRRKIENTPSCPRRIKSVRGVGYLFAPTVERG